MKHLVLILAIAIAHLSFAQATDSIPKPKPAGPTYRMVEVMPQFPGGKDSMEAFIKSNLKYPRSSRENSEAGKVVIEATVETDGTLSDIKVKTPVFPKLDTEALRIVKLMPKFSPGKQKGNLVRVTIMIPVEFVMPK